MPFLHNLNTIIRRVWTSPTANTWVSLFTRSVSLVLVLPLVLRNFPAREAAVWFVFSTVMAVQGILGFGFSPSFARLLAYARAGVRVEDMYDFRRQKIASGSEVNWDSIARLISCMSRVFTGLTLVSLLLMGTLGTAAVWRPIGLAGDQASIWIAWAVVVLGASLSFTTVHYVSILQGMDRLTEWRRWETLTSLGAIFTGFIVLLAGGRLLALVIASQTWMVIALFVFRSLCLRIENGRLGQLKKCHWEKPVFKLVWNSAWKSGLTGMLTYGLIQSTGIMQAQFGTAKATATYNFMLRIATLLAQVVQAPFLTKLPELARRRAMGDYAGQLSLIRRGMRLTHWSTVAAIIGISVFMPVGLKLIGSRSVIFDPLLWAVFGTNLLLERQGGMLHQIRNLTNQPMEHFGMAGYFIINVTLIVSLHAWLGMYVYPVAMLGAQLLFAFWYAGYIGYPVIGMQAWKFERTVFAPPAITLIAWNTVVLWWFYRNR